MNRKLLILHPYLSDRALEIYADSSASSSMPVSNLLLPQPTDWWRSGGVGLTPYVDVHLPDLEELELEWNTVIVGYTNSGPESLWKVVSAATRPLLDTPAWDSTWLTARPVVGMDRPGEPEWRHARLFLGDDAVRSEPWVRIYWDGYSTAEPFVQWGRLMIGKAWRPPYHRDRGAGIVAADERPRRVQAQGGATHFGRGQRPRKYRFTVGFVEEDEMLSFGYELDRVVGASGDLAVIEDPNDAEHLHKRFVIGTVEPGEIRHDDWNTWSRTYTVTEML